MSLLSPERVLLSLAPGGVHAVAAAGRRIRARHHAPAGAAAGRAPWQGAIDALHDGLAAWPLHGAASLVLSNAFVRYATVPHAGEVPAGEERLALARAQLEKLHGERARDWEVRVVAEGRSAPGLAIAVDGALVEAVKACFQGKRGVRLVSVQPYLMSAFNSWRAALPAAGAWLLLGEPDRTCIALLDGRRWVAVCVAREAPPQEPAACLARVRREQARMATGGPRLVLATLPPEAAGAEGEWVLQGLPFSEGEYAMALTAR